MSLTFGVRPKLIMRQMLIRMLLLTGFGLLAFSHRSFAWSSRASRTENDIRQLSVAIRLFRDEFGRVPAPQQYWIELQHAGLWESPKAGAPLDAWGRPLVYRVPGRQGEFDLHSLGSDGIDQGGRLDDISSWAGVHDGFHWKSTWPAGRLALGGSIVLGLGCLLLFRYYPLRILAPIAAALVCFGVLLGCQLLMHPGIVPSRNQPLAIGSAVAGGLLVVLLTIVAKNARKMA
ncbi:MAG TPA: type II secretion system protein GspG [Chthoniobacteraceae bacterium]